MLDETVSKMCFARAIYFFARLAEKLLDVLNQLTE